jgi:hypothetical protein
MGLNSVGPSLLSSGAARHSYALVLSITASSDGRPTQNTSDMNRTPDQRGIVIRFRSGVHYDYVAVGLGGGRWRTTARVMRTDDSAPVNEFSWNPVNKRQEHDRSRAEALERHIERSQHRSTDNGLEL